MLSVAERENIPSIFDGRLHERKHFVFLLSDRVPLFDFNSFFFCFTEALPRSSEVLMWNLTAVSVCHFTE